MTTSRSSKLGEWIAAVGIIALATAAYLTLRNPPVHESTSERAETTNVAGRGRSAHALSLADNGSLHGQVRFRDGNACAGARVEISKAAIDADERLPTVVATTAADNAGEFSVGRLSAGRYFVTASDAASGDSGSIELELLNGEELGGVVVTVAPRADTIQGTVRDAGGGPISGAALRAISTSGVPLSLATSDDNGRYELQLDTTANRIAAAADGYVAVAKYVLPDRRQAVDFAMQPASSVSGRVLEGGHPVADATVWMWARDKRDTQTNVDGVFHFDDVGPGSYRLVARRGAAVGTSVMPVQVGIASSIDDVTIELQVGRTFTGRVIDSSGGGVANASVRLRAASDGRRPAQATATDEGGRFRLDAIAPGSYIASVTSTDHAALHERVDLVRGDATDRELVVQTATKLCGRALASDGQPAVGAMIVARDATRATYRARTDEEGAFCLDELPPGDFELEASHDEHGFATLDTVTANGSDAQLVELRFGRPGSLSGRVRWEDGTAASGVSVAARISGRGDLATRTDAKGQFRFGAVGAGHATVMAAREHHAWFVGSPSGPHQWAGDVSEGMDVTDVALTLRRADMTIAGRIMDVEGAPVAGATVAVRVGMTQQRYFTLDDGTFVLEGLERGTYDIMVEHGN